MKSPRSDTLLAALITLALAPTLTVAREEPAKADAWQATLVPATEAFTNAGRHAYFILEPAHQLVLTGKEDGEPAQLTLTVLDQTQDVAGVSTRVVEERETVGGKLVEVSRNFFALGVTTGNLYYFGEDVDMYEDGRIASHGGAWQAGVGGAKHGILLPGSVRIGDRYYQEQAPGIAMDRAENVSTNLTFQTPAGTFKNCLKTRETTPLESGAEYKLYAPGVGLVQDGGLKLVRHGSKP
jgi:hypothetical protein